MVVGGSRCAMASEGPCSGRYERHHVFPKERLKRQFKYGARIRKTASPPWWEPADRTDPVKRNDRFSITLASILADDRNMIWLCSEGHHERVTNHRKYTDIPGSVWEFCRDFGLTAALENDIARRAA